MNIPLIKWENSQVKNQSDYLGFQKQTNFTHSSQKRNPFFQITNQMSSEQLFQKIHHTENQRPQSNLSQLLGRQNQLKKYHKTSQHLIKQKIFNQKSDSKTFSLQLISIVQDNIQTHASKQKKYRFVINQETIKKLMTLSQKSNQFKEVNCEFQQAGEEYEQKQKNDFSFFTMIGNSKSGKSFILNQIFNQKQKCHHLNSTSKDWINYAEQMKSQTSEPFHQTFSVNHTFVPGTKGIWISSYPLRHQKKGLAKQIYFIDTQGFSSHETNQQIDYKLMVLCILISDILCYNSKGPIDQKMINQLSVATQISKLIQDSQNKVLVKIPTLLLLLRDFSLELKDQFGNPITSDQYFQKCLSTQKQKQNSNRKEKSKQNIKLAIKNSFKSRKCDTLLLPFDEQGKLREQFKFNLDKVKKNILDLTFNQKRNEKSQLNSLQNFINKLQVFVQYLNEKNHQNGLNIFPTITSIEISLKKVELMNAFKSIESGYNKLFQKYEHQLSINDSQVGSIQNCGNRLEQIKIKIQQQLLKLKNETQNKINHLLGGQKVKIKKSENQSFIINLWEDNNKSQEVQQINQKIIKILKDKTSHLNSTINKKFENIIKNHDKQNCSQPNQYENIQNLNILIINFSNCYQLQQLEEYYSICMTKIKDLKTKYQQNNIINKNELISLEAKAQIDFLKQKVHILQSQTIKSRTKSIKTNPQQVQNMQFSFKVQHSSKNTGYDSCYNCQKSFYKPYVIIPSAHNINTCIVKTIIKQKNQNQLHTKIKVEFIVVVYLHQKEWFIRRKLKDFNELKNIVQIMFHEFDNELKAEWYEKRILKEVNHQQTNLYQQTLDEIREQLNRYLTLLCSISEVRNSRIFQKFIKIKQEYLQQ